ncbi:SUMF1/EgtB/PvdO family nonheme iron enzyme [Armatimonas sp.]|uniref:SUMF1/EgtB/PvdO family nonheme iron enzyme n=1 Tax=Armatimonas sp. TaxID=1872638 RepID=UPI00286D1964|nr:SUMF1/EgtB/PvdO family nonheme iron enzyme [Armatimonas sp.]
MRRPLFSALFLAFIGTFSESHVEAQSLRPTRHEKLPYGPSMETAEPYRNWETHRGKAEECLAVVRSWEKTYNALVARCDGFFVVPQTAWQAQLASEKLKKLEVIVTQAEGEGRNGPFPITAALRRETPRADYQILKINDHHMRSLPLLASHQLQKDTPLVVMWATLKPEGQTLQVQKRRALCRLAPSEPDAYQAQLTYTEGTAPPSGLPSGALVVDEASGAAVGMITDANKPTEFSTWRYWHDFIADVGLAPDRDAARGKAPQSDAKMVKVPGGPVRIMDQQCSSFVTSFGTDIACTPDFYCDINPVTNGDYFPWRAKLKLRPPLPLTSQNTQNPPQNYPAYPVAGLGIAQIEDYVVAQNKRLLTEVEYMRAAYTRDMSWLKKLDQLALKVTDFLYHAMSPGNVIRELDQQRPNPQQLGRSSVNDELTMEQLQQAWENANSQEATEGGDLIFGRGRATVVFGHTHSILLVPEDVSDSGVRHVHLNAPEVCQGWGEYQPAAPKTRPALVDPFLSGVRRSFTSVTPRSPLYVQPGIGARDFGYQDFVSFISSYDNPVVQLRAWMDYLSHAGIDDRSIHPNGREVFERFWDRMRLNMSGKDGHVSQPHNISAIAFRGAR